MVDELTEVLYQHPEDCRACGAALFSAAGLATIAGLYVKVGTAAVSIATSIAGQPAEYGAAQLLPGMWTWWIPESLAGFLLYAAVGAAGLLLARAAKKVQKLLRAL
ncbi:hypothetical protein LZ009_09400 [Ramlibacter sp. XY19]|uniref:hypothetical protein n=1 Tax=Ramlibacter paludis TaxID=2908000 RepID=UPI0023DBB2C3|nr:hypothetical protein [Ramlibacter paludis]MCG2592995.1 hypothetical protein [Ramlibacter paludis]